ncbi:MAG TPA: sigma-70 family RNA polymerase sigma factor [Planctomycetota bacterium]
MSERRAGEFREVVRQLTGRLLAAARFHLGDAHEAEDLVQTALLKAWQNWDETGVRGAIEAWLFTVVRNLCVDHRRKKRAKTLGDEMLDVARPGEAPSRLPEVQEAMRHLPEPYRSVLYFRLTQKLSYQEISEVLGVPLGTAKSLLCRGLRKVRERVTGIEKPR